MKILVFPHDTGNPYQSLLYSSMLIKNVHIKYLKSLAFKPTINTIIIITQIIWYRFCGYSVFHLHWVYSFAPGIKVRQLKFFNVYAYWCYIATLMSIKILGYKLVWTAHNVLPHESVFVNNNLELKARKYLIALADLVITHSESTIKELTKFGLCPKMYKIIPHGSYIGVYENKISQDTARKILNLTKNSFVYLFFGNIREYKGLDGLLEVYSKIRTHNTNLIIAGVCRDPKLRQLLNNCSDKSIIWHDGTVSNNDLQIYFNASDVVVLPFKKITTSGSSLLALSFGKAVIAPSMGDLASLPISTAYIYNPIQIDGLEQAMLVAVSNYKEVKKRGTAALEYAKSLTWTNIANDTLQAFENMFKK